ncbi:MAG: hypothetical protein COA78_34375 [Blastopirellula sp.]|nr:MAG: hypothetical protein COA78_34375 [Blastopirellula sp.]
MEWFKSITANARAAVAGLANAKDRVIPGANHTHYLVVFIEPGVAFWATGRQGIFFIFVRRNCDQFPALGTAVMFGWLIHEIRPQ